MVLRSTLRAVCEIEVSSGGCASGVATMAASTSASAPAMHSSHRMVLNDQTINDFGMIPALLPQPSTLHRHGTDRGMAGTVWKRSTPGARDGHGAHGRVSDQAPHE